jgi:hypothetical protein
MVLSRSTSYTKITDEKTRRIIRQCKLVNMTARISNVREYVTQVLSIYEGLNNNFDKETERIRELLARCIRIGN